MAAQYTAEQWYESANEGAAEEQFTGGGVIGKLRVELGYKIYVAGMTGEDLFKTWFPVTDPSKAGRKLTLATAKAFGQANGATGNPQYAVCLTMYKDECVNLSGDAVDWSHNQQKTVPMWTMHVPQLMLPGAEEVPAPSAAREFMGAMKANHAPIAEDFYGRVSWINDPYKEAQGEAGKTDQDRDGKARFPSIAVIADVYKNKKSAQTAAAEFAADAPGVNGSEPAAVTYPWADFPGEWGEDDWVKVAADAEMILSDGELVDATTYVEEEFDDNLVFLIRAMSVGGFKNKKIRRVTGAEMPEIKAALAIS